MNTEHLTNLLPARMRNQMGQWFEAIEMIATIRDRKVLASLGPPGLRGLLLQRGKQGIPTQMQAAHKAHFDWTYPHDNREMALLYKRAKEGQWNGESLPWEISVDPLSTELPLLPDDFVDFDDLEALGVSLDARERKEFNYSLTAWMMSQFLHGEQGALYAAAQVTEAVQFFDGKLYGATQVMDEGRHVEVFSRYIDTKLNKLYQINDNLYVVIDSLMTDSRWDMKFLGMQIMVEGLALGAFGVLYKQTREPLLKELLRNVIQDEARHVHYGVVALREHFREHITEAERCEREDWAFEVALLLRNRFLGFELYDEWFSHRLTRTQWRGFITNTSGMNDFRHVMFSRLVPNLREIGLLSPRIIPHYEKTGLMQYFNGRAADQLRGSDLLTDLQS